MGPMSSERPQRLSSIRLENFRSFVGPHEVPLDADVVLIWGRNGTGKTTLVQAIEYALTGEVVDLAHYSDDYPRCLASRKSSGPTSVGLSYRDAVGELREVEARIDAPEQSRGLCASESRYFRERCYLSQPRLSRLIDSYVTEERRGETPPLVRFVEEVLDLEELAALIDGLHLAGDVRWVRAEAPAYAVIETRVTETTESIRLARERLDAAGERLAESVEELRRLAQSHPALGLALPEGGNPEAVIRGLPTLGLSEAIDVTSDRLAAMEEDARLVRILVERIGSALETERRLAEAASETQEARDARARALRAIRSVAESAARTLLEGGLDATGIDPEGSPAAAIELAKSRLADSIQLTQGRLSETERLASLLETLEARRQSITSSLASVSGSESNGVNDDRLLELLQKSMDFVVGDECPVCNRDFAETGHGDLKQHLAHRMDALLAARELVQAQRQQWLAGKTELDQIDAQARSTRDRLQILVLSPADLAKHEEREAGLASLVEREPEFENATAELARALAAEERLTALREEAEQVRASGERILAIANKHDVDLGEQPSHASAGQHVLGVLVQRSADLTGEIEQLREADALLKNGRPELHEIENTRKRLLSLEARQVKERDALAAAQSLRSNAKELSDSAVMVRKGLLEAVFSDTLNTLWDSLFAWLAPHETFHPAFSPPEIVRRKLHLGMQTNTDSGTFCAPGSVLSAGNLNTAALTMFLALNLVQQARMPMLLLDDPVQSMDDVHLVNLAAMLRALQRDAGRQLVIAVHEKALFDYLTLELTPQGGSHTLLAVQLQNDPAKRIEWTRHSWVDDSISFGSAVSEKIHAS